MRRLTPKRNPDPFHHLILPNNRHISTADHTSPKTTPTTDGTDKASGNATNMTSAMSSIAPMVKPTTIDFPNLEYIAAWLLDVSPRPVACARGRSTPRAH